MQDTALCKYNICLSLEIPGICCYYKKDQSVNNEDGLPILEIQYHVRNWTDRT